MTDSASVTRSLYETAQRDLDRPVRSVTVRYDRDGTPIGYEVTTHVPLTPAAEAASRRG